MAEAKVSWSHNRILSDLYQPCPISSPAITDFFPSNVQNQLCQRISSIKCCGRIQSASEKFFPIRPTAKEV
jgi:hypothetical protein